MILTPLELTGIKTCVGALILCVAAAVLAGAVYCYDEINNHPYGRVGEAWEWLKRVVLVCVSFVGVLVVIGVMMRCCLALGAWALRGIGVH